MQYCEFDCEFEGTAIVMGRGRGEWIMKIADEKIEDYKIGRLFFDIYRHYAEPDGKADRPRLMR